MDIILRKDAIKLGMKRYFNGVPCPRGHVAERLVKGGCVVCDRADTLARSRRNAEKRAEYSRQYMAKNHEALLLKWRESNKARRLANPEKVKAAKSKSQKRNREAANARNKRWEDENRERVNARIAQWQKANPEKSSARTMRRHAAKLQRVPGWADQSAIGMIYRAAQLARVTWPEHEIHVDHVIPLRGKSVSGLHVHHNLQILTGVANRTKSISFERN